MQGRLNSEQLLAEADFMLGVDAELGYYTTEGGLIFPSVEVARIDIKPMPEGIGVIPGLYLQGDGKCAVAAINEALEACQTRKEGLHTAPTRVWFDSRRSAGHTPRISGIVSRFWLSPVARRWPGPGPARCWMKRPASGNGS